MVKCKDIVYVTLDDIEGKLKDFFANKTLIPILGAGFTKGEFSKIAKVPDGNQLNEYMKKCIIKKQKYNEDELLDVDLQETYDIFSEEIELNERQNFFDKYFVDVKLSEYKKRFLEINWWYVYTLNIDDAIEYNSEYENVINICRPINNDVLKDRKCVLKLHGDIRDFVNYQDAKLIFSQNEYLNSIKDNGYLLSQLKTDYESNNLIYIGCSLSEELDILSITSRVNSNNDVYLVSSKKFNKVEINKLKKYKINHVILVDDYNEFYDKIYKIWEKSKNVTIENLKPINTKAIEILPYDDEINLEYLLRGKELSDNGDIKLPYFYIERSCLDNVLNKLYSQEILFINGKICSGKTYLLHGLAKRIVNKKVYILSSKLRINNENLLVLLEKSNVVILSDEKSLETEQIEKILNEKDKLKNNNTNIVIVCNKKIGEIEDKIHSYDKSSINIKEIEYNLSNKFNKDETTKISNSLTSCAIEIFREKQNIINNIVRIGDNLDEKTRYDDMEISLNNDKEIAAMIILLTEKKTYLKRAIMFDIVDELEYAVDKMEGFFEKERTYLYERNPNDTSNVKYVVNAEYWLLKKIRDFSVKPKYSDIVSAYKYIIKKIINHYGSPNVNYYYNDMYKQYIKYDNINKIFLWNNSSGNLNLIKNIYDGLSDLLSAEPRYMHQKAKCYVRLAYASKDKEEKNKYLYDAFRFINVTISIFNKRFEESGNYKVKISLDRSLYTAAVITCYIAKVEEYQIDKYNLDAIKYLYLAFSSKNNTYKYADKDDTFKFEEYFQNLIFNNNRNNDYEKYRNKINYLMKFYINVRNNN